MNNELYSYARTSKSNNSGEGFTHRFSPILFDFGLLSLSSGVFIEFGALRFCNFCCCPQMMKKSVIGPDFEKKDAVPPYSESKKAIKLKHRVSFTK